MQNQSIHNHTRNPIKVCSLYKFTALAGYTALRTEVHGRMLSHDILGTILLAHEGINGTVAGKTEDIDLFVKWLQGRPEFQGIEIKSSYTDKYPFKRAKAKLKKEIVTMGVENIDPNESVGTYVEAENWNNLIDDPEILLIDTRNEYEINVGQFENAINPHTTNFRQIPQYVNEHLDPQKHKKVAMYCTGGIRCEKSTAFLKQQGFEEVYHLKGGILKYLEKVPQSESKWLGECFVFDDRVTVNHDLEKGSYDQCHACRLPITEEDKTSEHYIAGISCPACYATSSDKDKQRFAERQKQINLAKARGEKHMGPQK